MARTPSHHAIERELFVEDLLAIMSLEEKAGQMVLQPFPQRLETTDIRHLRDQLRRGHLGGLIGGGSAMEATNFQRIAIEETRLGIPLLLANDAVRGEAMIMPAPIALAASWAPDVVERLATVVADDAREAGVNWMLGPDVTLCASVADKDFVSSWGASSVVAGRLAAAAIRGLQFADEPGRGLIACLRADDPSWTDRRDGQRNENRLRLVSRVLRDAAPGSLAIDPVNSDSYDNRDRSAPEGYAVGRPDGFAGIDLSEWAEVARAAGHSPARAPYQGLSVGAVAAAVRDGRIAERQLDDVVRKILGAKYDLGLFRIDSPSAQAVRSVPTESASSVALDAARHSIILLRNEPAILPLGMGSRDFLVVGLAAQDRKLPTAGANGEGTSLVEGLEALGLDHKFAPGLAIRHDQSPTSPGRLLDADKMAIGMASEAARRSRTVLVAIGDVIELGEAETTLLEALRAVNDNIVLITLGSRPLDPEIAGAKLPCVLHAGQLGSMSGHAIAEVLTGEFSPRGRLPVPLVDKGRVGLPLGHGLGFGHFAMGDMTIELAQDRVVTRVDLRNLGDRESVETVQLYIRRPEEPGLDRKILADFQRASLVGGESRHLTFELGSDELGTFDRDGRLVIEPGVYEIGIGLNERHASLREIAISETLAHAIGRAASGNLYPGLFAVARASR